MRKLSPVTTAQVRVVVVAFNVAGLNGIADGWRRNGLGPSSPVVCGPPRNCTFPAPCATIWIELADCSIFALSSVRIVRESSEFSTTVASLVLEAQVVSLSEGTVTFRMHLPVTDTVVWSYQSMDGALVVAAVADAGRSNLTVSQGGGRNASADGARFESTNGAPPLLVEVAAYDVDGFPLARAGETVTVIVSLDGQSSTTQQVQSVYDEDSQRYRAVISGLVVVGRWSVELETPIGRAAKTKFALTCASGYDAASSGECRQQQSACDAATTTPTTVDFVAARDSMALANLGSARTVELLPLSNSTSFPVSAGRANVTFARPGSFLVRITMADGRQCTLPRPRTVSCPPGQREADSQCVPMVEEDPCAGFELRSGMQIRAGQDKDRPLVLHAGSSLAVSSRTSAADRLYSTMLVPSQSTEIQAVADAVWLNQTGNFSLQLLYPSPSGGSSKQCLLAASIVVQCGASEQEIGGKCYPIVQSACDLAQVSFSVADDPAKGARSLIQAALSLPAGATASVTATPQNSTVALPLQRVGSGGGWKGSVALPTTGQWSIGLTIGREQCIAKTATFDTQCMQGFISDGRGCSE